MKVYLVIKQLKSDPSQWIVDKADVRKDVALAYRTKEEKKNPNRQYYVLDISVSGDQRKEVSEILAERDFHHNKEDKAQAGSGMEQFHRGNVSGLDWVLGIHD